MTRDNLYTDIQNSDTVILFYLLFWDTLDVNLCLTLCENHHVYLKHLKCTLNITHTSYVVFTYPQTDPN